MTTVKKDYSYGVIPLCKNQEGEIEVFVLNQISVRGDVYWTFPKGHPEAGESNDETALRELKEESSLVAELDLEKTFIQKYSFKHEGEMVDKTVTYYLGWVADKKFTIQPQEVKEAKWCTLEEAHELLTHSLAKATLQEVNNYLHQ